VAGIVKNDLIGFGKMRSVGDQSARIGIAVEAREVAARDFQANAMALQEYVTGDAGIYLNVV
jgi:hypothetical protein